MYGQKYNRTCGNCAFFSPKAAHDEARGNITRDPTRYTTGHCRRLPPKGLVNEKFPYTQADFWCGEWWSVEDSNELPPPSFPLAGGQ